MATSVPRRDRALLKSVDDETQFVQTGFPTTGTFSWNKQPKKKQLESLRGSQRGVADGEAAQMKRLPPQGMAAKRGPTGYPQNAPLQYTYPPGAGGSPSYTPHPYAPMQAAWGTPQHPSAYSPAQAGMPQPGMHPDWYYSGHPDGTYPPPGGVSPPVKGRPKLQDTGPKALKGPKPQPKPVAEAAATAAAPLRGPKKFSKEPASRKSAQSSSSKSTGRSQGRSGDKPRLNASGTRTDMDSSTTDAQARANGRKLRKKRRDSRSRSKERENRESNSNSSSTSLSSTDPETEGSEGQKPRKYGPRPYGPLAAIDRQPGEISEETKSAIAQEMEMYRTISVPRVSQQELEEVRRKAKAEVQAEMKSIELEWLKEKQKAQLRTLEFAEEDSRRGLGLEEREARSAEEEIFRREVMMILLTLRNRITDIEEENKAKSRAALVRQEQALLFAATVTQLEHEEEEGRSEITVSSLVAMQTLNLNFNKLVSVIQARNQMEEAESVARQDLMRAQEQSLQWDFRLMALEAEEAECRCDLVMTMMDLLDEWDAAFLRTRATVWLLAYDCTAVISKQEREARHVIEAEEQSSTFFLLDASAIVMEALDVMVPLFSEYESDLTSLKNVTTVQLEETERRQELKEVEKSEWVYTTMLATDLRQKVEARIEHNLRVEHQRQLDFLLQEETMRRKALALHTSEIKDEFKAMLESLNKAGQQSKFGIPLELSSEEEPAYLVELRMNMKKEAEERKIQIDDFQARVDQINAILELLEGDKTMSQEEMAEKRGIHIKERKRLEAEIKRLKEKDEEERLRLLKIEEDVRRRRRIIPRSRDEAAIRIQKVWRGWLARCRVAEMRASMDVEESGGYMDFVKQSRKNPFWLTTQQDGWDDKKIRAYERQKMVESLPTVPTKPETMKMSHPTISPPATLVTMAQGAKGYIMPPNKDYIVAKDVHAAMKLDGADGFKDGRFNGVDVLVPVKSLKGQNPHLNPMMGPSMSMSMSVPMGMPPAMPTMFPGMYPPPPMPYGPHGMYPY